MTKALVVLSGGQDSTTCLAWALEKFDHIEAITFDYGQRHRCELDAAKKIAELTQIPQQTLEFDLFSKLTENALTNHQQEITSGSDSELPSTFVPGRNLIFLTLAAIHAHKLGITDLVTGVCQTDYSGYPDCREEFIKSAENTISLALDQKFTIHTPLMHMTKAETVKMMQELGQIELLKHSHTCYEGKRPACGQCPACKLRLKGFQEAGINDPLDYQD